MKFIKDRKELAQEINIKNTPVVTIDITRPLNGDHFYEHCYGGTNIKVNTPCKSHPDMQARCSVEMFGDEEENKDLHCAPWCYGRIVLKQGVVGIHSGFGCADLREMIEWNAARSVSAGDEIIVVFDAGDNMFVRKMRVGRVSEHCSTVAVLEDVE